MPDPLIQTRRLVLRQPASDDLDAWAALDADAEATRFIGGVQNRRQSRSGMTVVRRMWERRGCSLFSVIERQSGQWIGRVGPWVPDGHIGTEIGWAIARPFWGKGYAFEAAEAAMAWAFDHLRWNEIIHCIDAANLPSIALAERLGSRWMREQVDKDGAVIQVYGQRRGG